MCLGREENGFRGSVFLAAYATGHKLPPLIVFAGLTGCPVSQTVWGPRFGAPGCGHTAQRKAYFSKEAMLEWIPWVRI